MRRLLGMVAVSGRRRRTLAALAAAGLALALGACGGDPEPEVDASTTVEMGDFSFRPVDLAVPADAQVRLVNVGQVAHTWVIRGVGKGSAPVAPGRSATLDLTGVPPGRYDVFCDEPGHAQAGQVGTVTIG